MSQRKMRAGQLVSPFGTGAVIDHGGESFSCMDVSKWPQGDCPVIPNNPLRPVLGLDVRSPPTGDRSGEVPVCRFPRWLFCPTCRRLYHYTAALEAASNGEEPRCPTPDCEGTRLNPMRFIAACKQGHLQDVDWFRWAHRNAQASSSGQCSRQTAQLFFQTTGASGGDFNAMSVECGSCHTSNTLEGLTQGPYTFGCAGRQPWQEQHQAANCTELPRVFPRVASNVYYAQTRSAIDIAVQSGGRAGGQLQAFAAWLDKWPLVGTLRGLAPQLGGSVPKELYEGDAREAMRLFGIREAEALAGFAAAISAAPRGGGPQPDGPPDNSQQGILLREWPHLSRPTPVDTRSLRTSVISLAGQWPAEFSRVFEQVTLVHRLREVRALLGFRRVHPDSSAALVPVDLGAGTGWLPGVEAFGEGIFLKFHELAISDWEQRVSVPFASRSRELESACDQWGRTPTALHASARFVALHTFAHVLVRRLAFDAGYSAASIRERIYCGIGSQPAAGVMLYTSDGDSEGSLGGLVRQGEPDRLFGTVGRALADMSWCSADPVCRELEAQGVDGLNSAACHACALVSETSCSYNNSLLDRRLLIGAPGIPGLLEELVQAVI